MDSEDDVSPELAETLDRHRSSARRSGGTVVVSESEGYVGDEVTLKGRNLPPDEELAVVWHSVDGEWGVLAANEIVGPQYQPRAEQIATVETDASGAFDEALTVPADYGGGHTVEVQDGDGNTLDSTEFSIAPWFELDRMRAPVGDVFRLTGYGLGPNPVSNNYQVTWDNGLVGYVTGVANDGTATAELRAVGPPGEHVVRVWRNYRGIPFLQNNTQSPYGPVAGERPASWTVAVTEPERRPPVAAVDWMPDESPLPVHYPDLDEDTDAELEIAPTSGQPGTEALIRGTDFPPGATVDLVWYRHEGDFAADVPITPEPVPDLLPTVTADEDGAFDVDVTIPVEKGSTRPIVARVDGKSVAVTGFMMQPDVLDISPAEGPVGTEIEIALAGVGWPAYSTVSFVYDNRLLGYVCGNSGPDEPGVTRTAFEATGEPGYHCIDAYPTIFEMQEPEPNFELLPHLSYLDNHPVRPLPAIRFTFEITE